MDLHVQLVLLGVPFRLVTNHRGLADLVEVLWAPFLGDRDGDGGEVVEVRRSGDAWRLEAPPDPPVVARDPWVLAVVLRNVIAGRAIRSRPDLIPLHGSVVEREGLHLAFSGPSRTGKTWMVTELLLEGWRLVSDDLLPIGPDARAVPFPKPLQVRDAGRWAALCEAWEVPEWLPPPSEAALVPPGALALAPQRPYAPDVLVFSRWDPSAQPEATTVPAAEAVGACVENLQAPRDLPAILGTLGRVCANATTARLVYPSSAAALSLLRPLLQEKAPNGIIF